MDWVLEELETDRPGPVLGRALRPIADSEPDEYIDASSAEIALAAAAIVAAINGYPADDLPWQATRYVRRPEEPRDELKYLAILAVNRTLAANSELADAYAEASPSADAEWRTSMEDLRRRLSAPVRETPPITTATRWRLARSQGLERLMRLLLVGRR
jgi:hypothetical protein